MILEDLAHIFKPQFDEGTTELYYMVEDKFYTETESKTATVFRHSASDLESLLPFLDSLQYVGIKGRMPRFTK